MSARRCRRIKEKISSAANDSGQSLIRWNARSRRWLSFFVFLVLATRTSLSRRLQDKMDADEDMLPFYQEVVSVDIDGTPEILFESQCPYPTPSTSDEAKANDAESTAEKLVLKDEDIDGTPEIPAESEISQRSTSATFEESTARDIESVEENPDLEEDIIDGFAITSSEHYDPLLQLANHQLTAQLKTATDTIYDQEKEIKNLKRQLASFEQQTKPASTETPSKRSCPSSTVSVVAPKKRGPGRPRKNPLPEA